MNEDMVREIKALRAEVRRLNNHRFLRVNDNFWWMLGNALARGLMMGLGTVVGATLLLSVLVWMLSQIEFLPIVGEWAKEIAVIVKGSESLQ